MAANLSVLLDEIRACTLCAKDLPLGPRPVLRASGTSIVLIAGQAPGTKVHASGIPWNDPSGDRLRLWLGLDKTLFYDERRIAIVPMGFCYPGKGASGDLPPRTECRSTWHPKLIPLLKSRQITFVIGSFALEYHLGTRRKKTLTDTIRAYKEYLPNYCVLPHPSPRNTYWLKQNPWFESECIPKYRALLASALA